VAPTVDNRHSVEGVLASLEILVLNMFSFESGDHIHLRQNKVSVDSYNHAINDEVSPSFRKVQHHQVSRARAVIRTHASFLLNDRCLRHP
jgi:hypothetical protein